MFYRILCKVVSKVVSVVFFRKQIIQEALIRQSQLLVLLGENEDDI